MWNGCSVCVFTGHTASRQGCSWVARRGQFQMKHKHLLCVLSSLFSSFSFQMMSQSPPPAQCSVVQAELIYPSAVLSNPNKQISPHQHLEPLTYLETTAAAPSLGQCLCVREHVSVYRWESVWENTVGVNQRSLRYECQVHQEGSLLMLFNKSTSRGNTV